MFLKGLVAIPALLPVGAVRPGLFDGALWPVLLLLAVHGPEGVRVRDASAPARHDLDLIPLRGRLGADAVGMWPSHENALALRIVEGDLGLSLVARFGFRGYRVVAPVVTVLDLLLHIKAK